MQQINRVKKLAKMIDENTDFTIRQLMPELIKNDELFVILNNNKLYDINRNAIPVRGKRPVVNAVFADPWLKDCEDGLKITFYQSYTYAYCMAEQMKDIDNYTNTLIGKLTYRETVRLVYGLIKVFGLKTVSIDGMIETSAEEYASMPRVDFSRILIDDWAPQSQVALSVDASMCGSQIFRYDKTLDRESWKDCKAALQILEYDLGILDKNTKNKILLNVFKHVPAVFLIGDFNDGIYISQILHVNDNSVAVYINKETAIKMGKKYGKVIECLSFKGIDEILEYLKSKEINAFFIDYDDEEEYHLTIDEVLED